MNHKALSARGALSLASLLIFLGCLIVGGRAQGQVFSPGELHSAHAEWDSLRNCDSCHASQNQVDPERCFECHTTIEVRAKKRQGFHGSAEVRGESCETCHTDHAGRGAEIIEWPRGKKENFPHAKTGWPLRGAHSEEGCEECHETRRIVDKDILKHLKTFPQKETYLGLDSTCTTCHFDEHRGALGDDCLSCHTQVHFDPAPKFDHGEFYPLKGAHTKVECVSCHAEAEDTTTSKSAFPAPESWTYLTYEDIPHESCTDCHEDIHQGRLGDNCLDCHTVDSWAADQVRDKLAFHETTRYPLRGEHRQVTCQSCHPTRNGKKLLRPIPFESCTSCHPNAHPDTPIEDMAEGCESCHTVDGFAPASFTVADHAETAFPIDGAHLTVGCEECHTQSLGPKIELPSRPKRIKGKLARKLLSPWPLKSKGDTEDCATCHATPHREQFADKACASCHSGASWGMEEGFDHSAHSDYPLEGKHREVDCALCHQRETDGEGSFQRFEPLNHEGCAPCHGDVHYGQFEEIDPPLKCEDCHVTEGFESLSFEHNDPAFSDFPLKGAHSDADCQVCHLDVQLTPIIKLTAFRPLPSECGVCHEDNHKGAYKEAGKLVSVAREAAKITPTLPWGLPSSWAGPHGDDLTDCAACHVEERWHDLSFNHDLTRFPLKGGHVKTTCQGCHTGPQAQTPPMDCASCHQDLHRGTLGTDCQSCHSELSFNEPTQMLARHATSSFPLIGQHAIVPCTECHADARDLSFADAPGDCAACHAQEAPRLGDPGLDHSGLTDCASCHTPLEWKAGALVDHGRCFPIQAGTEHAGITCQACHTGGIPSVIGTCNSGTVSCINCHGCEADEHDDVRGYECQDQKCYACHPGGDE